MKKLMLFLALTASVWSSFSFADTVLLSSLTIKQGNQSWCSQFTNSGCYTDLYVDSDVFFGSNVTALAFEHFSPVHKTLGTCTYTSGSFFQCGGQDFIYTAQSSYNHTQPPSVTCKYIEGAIIDGYHHSEESFCAHVGSTGGANPEPLLCQSTCKIGDICLGTASGYTHYVTAQSCSAVTGPTAPDDGGTDPEPPCTENCEPTDPETPPGGDDGTGIPDSGGGATGGNSNVGGTITDSDGKVTNIDLTIEQDFTPVTERLNETNKRLAAENKNSSTIIDRLNDLIHGTAENGDKLDGIKDAIAGIETGGDMSGVEGKLDGIKDSIDGIKDGFGTAADGESAANGVDLPDYSQKFEEAWGQVEHSQANGEGGEGMHRLNNIGDNLTSFESIPQLFAFAQDNCSPIPFGRRSLDVCSYAPTISNVLTWVVYLLTLIFFVRSIQQHLQNVRL